MRLQVEVVEQFLGMRNQGMAVSNGCFQGESNPILEIGDKVDMLYAVE